MKRSFKKPRGYGGDYKTIEMFYDQKTYSQGIGYYFDKYILDNTLAKADIYRKDRMKELLENFIDKTNLEKIEIVNFGCGGCKDLRDLFQMFVPEKIVNFTVVDQDLEALNFSKKIFKALPAKANIKYLQKNITELIMAYRNKNTETPFINKNLVYSIGLVDYFGDNTLQLFVRFCMKSLAPGGKLIFAHKNSDNGNLFFHLIFAWDFNRNKNEVITIIKDEIAGCSLKIRWEKTHHMFFLIITKKT
jgi:SAM-dependent methyltransferase